MEMGELVAVAFLEEQMDEKCPFKQDSEGPSSKEDEDTADDDVKRVQANKADSLGKNLESGSQGTSGTIGGPYTPDKATSILARDTANGGVRVRVPGTGEIDTGVYPYQVAAHHLIPGNGSLYNDQCDLEDYMLKDKTVSAAGFTWTIKFHIGYNVNGAHNGLWMPGNYGLQNPSVTPTGVTWGAMTQEDWQMHYVAACSKGNRSQFHDEHSQYNESVRSLLNTIAEALFFHQVVCKECHDKGDDKVPPPYLIKERLYNLSRYFKNRLTSNPQNWVRPWFTSNRWRDVVFGSGSKPSNAFLDAYDESAIV
jgi:hypothetical protein